MQIGYAKVSGGVDTTVPLRMMLGGLYKMCYAPRGDFNHTSTIVTHSLP